MQKENIEKKLCQGLTYVADHQNLKMICHHRLQEDPFSRPEPGMTRSVNQFDFAVDHKYAYMINFHGETHPNNTALPKRMN